MLYRFMAIYFLLIGGVLPFVAHAQTDLRQSRWVDSVFSSISDEERIAQLMVIRTSAPGSGGKAVFYNDKVDSLVKLYNVGGVCLFQGTPTEQAELLNRIQGMAKTPIMVTVDGEWGLGMRFAGVQSFPYQLTMGAMNDKALVYRVGKAIADQCLRMGIHVNYAPVIDVNNNAKNPVIGYRSFGENREKVAEFGTSIMLGMQDAGVMACAKHFPGHGDVEVDSHYDLPVINKTREQLDSLELFPFRALFKNGIGSVMIAHLYIPSIDNTANRATSLSSNNVTTLMREELGYQGLTFTDALEMKGVAKYYPGGEAAVQSIIAGNDMLCLPEDVPATIAAIRKAIEEGRLTWQQVYDKCKRVLASKYEYVAGKTGTIDTTHLNADLNKDVDILRKSVAEKALTLLRQEAGWAPIPKETGNTLLIQAGGAAGGALALDVQNRGGDVLYVSLKGEGLPEALSMAGKAKYKKVIVALAGLGRSPASRFGISPALEVGLQTLGKDRRATLVLMGNPYALEYIDPAGFGNIAVAYEDDAVFQHVVFDWLSGVFSPEGKLPVSVGLWKAGHGLMAANALMPVLPESVGMSAAVLQQINQVAQQGIDSGAFPGCVVMVLHKGKKVFEQAYGHLQYEGGEPVGISTIYDLASVSKISATNISLMKLYEDGLLDLEAPVSRYLPWLTGTDKDTIKIKNMLLHQSGLIAFIPFYKEVIDSKGTPLPSLFRDRFRRRFSVPVTDQLFMRRQWVDTLYSRIAQSALLKNGPRYVYSDNNFILLAQVVKSLSGKSIDAYARDIFYKPMGLQTTGYLIYKEFDKRQIAPTENEKQFRQGLLWGYVHDPGAAMFGNVAGHAGLFSNASDLASLYQMLLNGGSFDGRQYLKKETINLFTSYQSDISRRGFGFDKPEKDNAGREPEKRYPATFVSSSTFGHTGYTGTCVWVDPEKDLVYVFLSNRVYAEGGENRKLLTLNIRGRIHDIIYQSLM